MFILISDPVTGKGDKVQKVQNISSPCTPALYRCNDWDYHFDAVFFFPSIGQQPSTWPANNCLEIMICSCVVQSKHVLLQIIFCSCVIQTTFSRENGWSLPWAARKWLNHQNKLRDRIIKKLLNSIIAKYHDLSESRRSIIDQLATDNKAVA